MWIISIHEITLMINRNNFFLKLKNNKNNIFITINDSKGSLLTYKSLKERKTKDIKSKIIWGVISILKKLKYLKIKYINMSVCNLNVDLIQQIIILCKTWGLTINGINYFLKMAHNGCRKSRKSRKRNKSRKKNKSSIF